MAVTNYNTSIGTVVIFQDQTTDATSNGFLYSYPMKRSCLKFWGTWGGATIQFFTGNPLDGTLIPITDGLGNPILYSQNGQVTIEHVVFNDAFYVTLASASGSTSISVTSQAV